MEYTVRTVLYLAALAWMFWLAATAPSDGQTTCVNTAQCRTTKETSTADIGDWSLSIHSDRAQQCQQPTPEP
jgi:hypothetical protein